MTFEAPLRFDLADVQAALPAAIASVDTQTEQDVRWCISSSSARWTCARSARTTTTSSMSSRSDRARTASRTSRADLGRHALAEKRAARRRPSPPAPRPAEGRSRPVAKPAKAAETGRGAERRTGETPRGAKSPEATQAGRKPQSRRGPPRPLRASSRPMERRVECRRRRAGDCAGDNSGARGRAGVARGQGSDATAPVVVEARRQGDAVRLTFPFAAPTPAAMFRRGDTIWLVFDSKAPIDIGKIAAQSGRSIRNATVTPSQDGQVVQLKLDQPKLTSAGSDGATWTVIVGDMMLEPTQPLSVVRLMQGGGATASRSRSRIRGNCIAWPTPRSAIRCWSSPRSVPARGFLKPQDFVEFNALVSTSRHRGPAAGGRRHRRGRCRQGGHHPPGRAHAVERERAPPAPRRRRATARAAAGRACSRSIRRPGVSTASRISASGRIILITAAAWPARRSARRRSSSWRASIWRAT
jgi:hypothetical protein